MIDRKDIDQMLAFRQGEQIFQGSQHGNEFHEEDYDMGPLLSAFAEL